MFDIWEGFEAIQRQNKCQSWVKIGAAGRAPENDWRVDKSNGTATIIAETDLKILKPFSGDSMIALKCVGKRFGPENFHVGLLLRVRKAFEFRRVGPKWRGTIKQLYPLLNATVWVEEVPPPPPLPPGFNK